MMKKTEVAGSPHSGSSALFDLLLCIYQVLKCFIVYFYQLIFPRKPKSLHGEVAMVTGAGGGLGRELALQLASLGVKIIAVDINKDSLEETLKMLRVRESTTRDCLSFICDVSNPEDVACLVKKIDQVTRVTMLVNNAGIAFTKPFLKHSVQEMKSLFEVNVLSHIYLLKEYLPRFIEEDKGHIVSIGSIAGSVGTSNLVPYCSTKFAIRGLTESLFMELREIYPNSSIKMTTAHPYTFSSSLIPKPKNRFDFLFPIMTPSSVAQVIIEAVRRDEEVLTVPFLTGLLSKPQEFLPRTVIRAVRDYLDCGVHEDVGANN